MDFEAFDRHHPEWTLWGRFRPAPFSFGPVTRARRSSTKRAAGSELTIQSRARSGFQFICLPRSRCDLPESATPPLVGFKGCARAIGFLTPRHQASTHRQRSEEHTSELQSLMRISYAVFC